MSTSPIQIPTGAPLSSDQVNLLNGLLPSLQPDQLLWLEGFVSGLRTGQARGASVAAPAAAAPAEKPEVTVLFGSESGNAESLADQTVKSLNGDGFKSRAVNMADITPAKLNGVENLLVLVSTWGEGDPPETAVDFYEKFMADGAPKLENTRFSVLSLGDTSYEHFCQMGKDFDARLEKLGARRIFPRKDCDVDFDDDYAEWARGVIAELQKETKASAGAIEPPEGAATAAATVATTAAPLPAAAPAPTAAPVKYSKKNPFPSPLKERILLNGRGSAKETLHLEFDLEGSGLTYEVGDALAVVPHNAEDVVEDILTSAKLDPDAPVTVKEVEYPLREALTTQLDITGLSLPVLKRYNEIAQDAKLTELLLPENKKQLQDYLWGRELVDVLQDFPADFVAPDALVGILRKLPPRLYSIASSLKAHPDEVHLTVGAVRYDAHGRKRKGVCSTYLADRLPESGTADVFVTPNKNFKLPADPDTPIIMVGPGTGIAPFRAFVEERQATGAKGKNWLIFGDQRYLTDFLYQTEWQGYLKDGVLNKLDLAFSRDQAEKIYVQHRMYENAKTFYDWLEQGAVFYVCGDASRMANDVDRALHEIVADQGGLSEDDATAYVKKLKADKRYLRDVY